MGYFLKILFVPSLFLICLCLSALEEQLLLRSLEVAVLVGDGGDPHGPQDTTGYMLPRYNQVRILLNSFTLCRFSHEEKDFWQVAGKSSGL